MQHEPHHDPIFAAIDRHWAAVEAYDALLLEQSTAEEALPRSRRRSDYDGTEVILDRGDAPLWQSVVQRVASAEKAMNDAALSLLNCLPQSAGGAAALLKYVVEHIDRYDGEAIGFPDDLVPDGVDPDTASLSACRSAEFFVMQNVVRALSSVRP